VIEGDRSDSVILMSWPGGSQSPARQAGSLTRDARQRLDLPQVPDVSNSIGPTRGEHVAVFVEGKGKDTGGVTVTVRNILLFPDIPESHSASVGPSGEDESVRMELGASEPIGISIEALLGQTHTSGEVVEAPAGILGD
jgi:hypothetical protein